MHDHQKWPRSQWTPRISKSTKSWRCGRTTRKRASKGMIALRVCECDCKRLSPSQHPPKLFKGWKTCSKFSATFGKHFLSTTRCKSKAPRNSPSGRVWQRIALLPYVYARTAEIWPNSRKISFFFYLLLSKLSALERYSRLHVLTSGYLNNNLLKLEICLMERVLLK